MLELFFALMVGALALLLNRLSIPCQDKVCSYRLFGDVVAFKFEELGAAFFDLVGFVEFAHRAQIKRFASNGQRRQGQHEVAGLVNELARVVNRVNHRGRQGGRGVERAHPSGGHDVDIIAVCGRHQRGGTQIPN